MKEDTAPHIYHMSIGPAITVLKKTAKNKQKNPRILMNTMARFESLHHNNNGVDCNVYDIGIIMQSGA